MGLFNRKSSKVSVDGGSSSSTGAIQSPRSVKTPAGSSFGSLSLPNVTLPRPPDPNIDPAAYLRSIYAVRDRAKVIFEKAKQNRLNHFDVDMSKFGETATYVVSIIKVRRIPTLFFSDSTDGLISVTMRLITIRYLRMDGGNTLRLAADLVSTN